MLWLLLHELNFAANALVSSCCSLCIATRRDKISGGHNPVTNEDCSICDGSPLLFVFKSRPCC